MSYYDKNSGLYVEIPEGVKRKDLMGERFDIDQARLSEREGKG